VHRVAGDSFVNRDRIRSGRVEFALATRADDSEIRRLLRENPMPGEISISLEREPDAFGGAQIEGDEHHMIVARDDNGRVIAMGNVAIRKRYLNGLATRVGYLGQLRLDCSCRGRAEVIVGGYRFFRELHKSLGVKLYLTSIAADNTRARRLLERSLPGMPKYRPLREFVTLVFRRHRRLDFSKVTNYERRELRRQGLELRHGWPNLMPQVVELLNSAAARGHFRPVWSLRELETLQEHGLRPNHFRVIFEGDRPIACAAIWDQRSFRQAVVQGYSQAMKLARIPLNLIAPLTRWPRLPAVGEGVSTALLSHMVTPPNRPELIRPLVMSLHGSGHTLGVDSIGIGLESRDPRLKVLKILRGMTYRAQLYVVHYEDGREKAEALDDRLCEPEVALL